MGCKDCHPMTSPPMRRMMRKINSNSFWVVTTFFVPGVVFAKHSLWTSQQRYMPSPSHSWGDQPPLASVGPSDSECPSLDFSTSLTPSGTSALRAMMPLRREEPLSCTQSQLWAGHSVHFFPNIHDKLEEWALSISTQWMLLRLRQVGAKSWYPVLWIGICRSPEMITI